MEKLHQNPGPEVQHSTIQYRLYCVIVKSFIAAGAIGPSELRGIWSSLQCTWDNVAPCVHYTQCCMEVEEQLVSVPILMLL